MINGLLKLPVHCWRACFAPFLPRCCRFYPSCSEYALGALDAHSWPRALALIALRILRCNPFHPGGFDPVPPRHLKNGACGCPRPISPRKADTA